MAGGRTWGRLSTGDRAALDALADAGISLTLVDIGASLEPFRAFRPLLGRATYVGFDPDLREMHTEASESGRRVIVEQGGGRRGRPRPPPPSSSPATPPRRARCAPLPTRWRRTSTPTATRWWARPRCRRPRLDEALAAAGIDRLDWLKLDTQGTDLRLLESLSEPLFATLMAVDAEPGFDQHYETEDTFGELHRAMVERGFWLADLDLTRAVRLRRDTFDDALGARSKLGRMRYEFTLKTSPTAVGPALPAHAGLARQGRRGPRRLPAPVGLRGVLGQQPVRPRRHRRVPRRGTAPTTLTARLLDLSVRRNRRDARRGSWRLVEKVNVRNLKRFVTKSY